MRYKIATTTYVNSDIPCTFTEGLTIQDIGAISTCAKNIIGVLSGPMTACFNLLTINNVNTFFILCNYRYTFNHVKIKIIDNIDNLNYII